MKNYVKIILSRLNLIPVLDYFRSRCKYIKLKEKNRNFLKKNPSFIPPPLELAFDAYGHVDFELYEESGFEDARWIAGIILKYTTQCPLHVLDWGCGPVRVLKHMPRILASRTPELFGTDFNKQTFEWCQNNFPRIDFSCNDLKPPLHYPPSFFDAIYGLSVITHLSEDMQFAWIHELKRILKPNGVLILTSHGDFFRYLLSDQEKGEYDQGRLVVRDDITEGRRGFAAFHSPKFLKFDLFKEFHILEQVSDYPQKSIKQDIWVLQNR